MTDSKWVFTAQRGYFSHDDDPESWDFRATTRPSLGLLDRSYPTDDNSDNGRGTQDPNNTQWNRFIRYLTHLNQTDPENKQYKLFYIVRHGQGVHNVKEKEVGREEWERHIAKLPGDDKSTWLDAELTPTGEHQAKQVSSIWSKDGIHPPQSIYTSPLRRCLHTTALAFAPFIPRLTPVIKENLRERNGVHTCDQRSSRSWIAAAYPEFSIEHGFTETDELWDAGRRETLAEHVERSVALFGDVFGEDGSVVVGFVAHSGASMALFEAVGWGKIPVAAGAVYPLLVCRSRVGGGV
ncbi:histidine phosphatase superfamily [Phaeosphaeriaceae sp. PMI808]|nr:histidine phosphatase superfamily [Phaeosphaeriaceae sp. PMI808]